MTNRPCFAHPQGGAFFLWGLNPPSVRMLLGSCAPTGSCEIMLNHVNSQGPLNGGVSNGGVSRSGLFCPFLSFFVLFCPFWDFPDFSGIFPICSVMVRGFSRFFLFLFLGLLRAPTRNSPERVRDTIWTFPKKSAKHPGLETPRFSFSQELMADHANHAPNSAPDFCLIVPDLVP